MSNPTGSTYLAANPSYTWADGDVYEIQQTDEAEGAATGASFGGIGVENQPHLFLLNKINWLKRNLISTTSNEGVNGWYRFSSNDAALGQINIIEQNGIIPSSVVTGFSGPNETTISFSFPLAFTTVCWSIFPFLVLNAAATSGNLIQQNAAILPISPFGLTSNSLLLGLAGHGVVL